MMGWFENGWGMNGWNFTSVLGMVLMVAVWGGLIALAVWAIARFTRTEHPSDGHLASPRAILDRRLASGEIDAETYAQARRMLEPAST